MSKNQQKRRLAKLHAQSSACHWCACETVYMGGQPPKPLVRNRATLDHLYDKFDPRRGKIGGGTVEVTVLACWACNQRRGRERTIELADLHKRKVQQGQIESERRRQAKRRALQCTSPEGPTTS